MSAFCAWDDFSRKSGGVMFPGNKIGIAEGLTTESIHRRQRGYDGQAKHIKRLGTEGFNREGTHKTLNRRENEDNEV
ncbi:MAG TPA: hypothetical protein VGN23_01790 [Verrucomicrobiae bacterium]|jgi:hypothetical protein